MRRGPEEFGGGETQRWVFEGARRAGGGGIGGRGRRRGWSGLGGPPEGSGVWAWGWMDLRVKRRIWGWHPWG